MHAEKRYGRFGPEYFVSEQDLADAGLDSEPRERVEALTPAAPPRKELTRLEETLQNQLLREIVPLSLYQDLQMKHEQLLVQYGMVRAGGLRVMELRADLESKEKQLEESEVAVARLSQRQEQELSRLKRKLREAHLELEARRLEIDAMQEKIKALEMLTRNAITNEAIDHQVRRLAEQTRRVDDLHAERAWDGAQEPPRKPRPDDPPTDH
jgi:DNA repair exonuclease SbcCD ATPase subunit